jgi:hypothetical protein
MCGRRAGGESTRGILATTGWDTFEQQQTYKAFVQSMRRKECVLEVRDYPHQDALNGPMAIRH